MCKAGRSSLQLLLELCTKIGNALRKTGGAASDYQHVIVELQGLQNVLVRLAALEPTESNVGHVNAIRGMALACQFPLREFLIRIDKYGAALDPFATTGIVGAGKKAKWAVFVAEDVKKLRALVSAKTISINLLLATHASETLSRLEKIAKDQHRESFEKINEHCSLLRGISNQLGDVRSAIHTDLSDLSSQHARSSSQMADRLDKVSSDTSLVVQEMQGLAIGLAATETSLLSLKSLGTQIIAPLHTFPRDLRNLLQQTNRRARFNLLSVQTPNSFNVDIYSGSSVVRFEGTICPFCFVRIAPGALPRARHVGHHLEDIALTAIPRSYHNWDDYEGDSSVSSREIRVAQNY